MKYIAKIEGPASIPKHPEPFDCPECHATTHLTFSTDTGATRPQVQVNCPCGRTWIDQRVPIGLVIHAVRISERIV